MRKIDTGSDELLCHVDGPVGVITFNRPERRNALTDAMYRGFREVLPLLSLDAEVRVVMLTGTGGAFCAGGDVKAMNEANTVKAMNEANTVKAMNEANTSGGARDGQPQRIEEKISYLRMRQRWVSEAIHTLPKPVIAAMPGPAAGAGFSIALAADLRVIAESGFLLSAFANVGGSGDFGGSWFLTHLVGAAKAKEIYFTSPRITATEAKALGLVNQVFSAETFEADALAYCHDIAQRAPLALRYMKENINRAATADLGTALEAEATNMAHTMSTADHKEATAAFVEKRPPTFEGR